MSILGPPYCDIGAAIRIGREIWCLPYVGFLEETVEHKKIIWLDEYDNDGNFIGDSSSEEETEDDKTAVQIWIVLVR